MKHLTLKRLESDRADLQAQEKQLIAEYKELPKRLQMVYGAIRYIEQTIAKLRD